MHPAIENFQKHTTEFFDTLALFPERSRSVAPEGQWSAAYIVHHVADGELHFAARYMFALGRENPPMTYFEEERYPEALNYAGRTVAKSLASIMGIRAVILEILSSVDEQAWSRTTTAEDGTVFTLEKLVRTADEHLVSHIEQLKELHRSIA